MDRFHPANVRQVSRCRDTDLVGLSSVILNPPYFGQGFTSTALRARRISSSYLLLLGLCAVSTSDCVD